LKFQTKIFYQARYGPSPVHGYFCHDFVIDGRWQMDENKKDKVKLGGWYEPLVIISKLL
jgi:hypothetical protein